MTADPATVATAYSTAVKLGADSKVLLALFEAGIVESGFRNLDYGDRDSVGFLQQRPSQGWPDPTDVATATTSFVQRAKANEALYPNDSAGALAQSVQRSAYPDRYDQVQAQATSLLGQASNGSFTGATEDTSWKDYIPGYSESQEVGQLFSFVSGIGAKLTSPWTYIYAGMIIGGMILVVIGLWKLVETTKAGQTAKHVAGKAVEAAGVAAL